MLQQREYGNYAIEQGKEENTFKDVEDYINIHTKDLIGKYVDYTPDPNGDGSKGIYSVITNSDEYTGTINNTSDFETEDFGWRIWNIEGNTLTLIADGVTSKGGDGSGKLSLYGAPGYNNAVKILNDIGKTCYSTGEWAIGRSLNIEDIEKVLDKSVWKPENNSKGYLTTKRYYSSETWHPYIYELEEYSNLNGTIKEKGQGITRSTQTELYPKSTYGALRMGTGWNSPDYIELTTTGWEQQEFDAFVPKAFINPTYNRLLCVNWEEGAIVDYGLASRAVWDDRSRGVYRSSDG